MAQLIVRNLDNAIKIKLWRRAARNGRSMGQEVQHILDNVLRTEDSPRKPLAKKGVAKKGFGTETANLFRGIGLEEPIQELRGYSIKSLKFKR